MKNAKTVIQTLIISAVIACLILPQYNVNESNADIVKIDSQKIQPVLIENTMPVIISKEINKIVFPDEEPPISIPKPPRDFTPM